MLETHCEVAVGHTRLDANHRRLRSHAQDPAYPPSGWLATCFLGRLSPGLALLFASLPRFRDKFGIVEADELHKGFKGVLFD